MWKERLLEYMRSEEYRPSTVQELCERLGVTSAADFRAFVRLLNEMEDAGDLVRTKNNRYALPEQMNFIAGRLQLKARGYGFVIPENEAEADIYILQTALNGAMSGDRVLVRLREERGKGAQAHREGEIVKILERGNDRIVGQIAIYAHHAFVTPLDKRFPEDVFVPKDAVGNAHDGQVVVVELTSYPTATHGPVGRVVEVLGYPDEPGVDILAIVRKYNLPEAFPEDVLADAERIPLEIDPAEIARRKDFRGETIVTIDGDDAKDLDDAVHVKRLPNGHYELGVHIADVGYYVKENSPLDKEAFRRGTSVYLVDRVIPMLPPRLSNNICSLNPKVDRLTMSCVMEIDGQGRVVSHEIVPSVIRTAERMTYNDVRKILEDEDEELRARYAPLVPMFERMRELALILRDKRMRRGAIDFDFDEIKVRVNDLGEPTSIEPRPRSIAERIIEEFMLAANETVAEHFHWLGVPFIYRVHDEPDPDKIIHLNLFLHNFGYHVKGSAGGKVHPRALQEVLNEVEGKREARMISMVMLRSMQQAKYRPECTGHFGLAAEYYTHFTSPIRRYPDLAIHRIIREVLTRGSLSPQREAHLREFVAEASRQSSERERIAQEAEREVDQLKMVEYMQAHIDEEFDGIISGVVPFGLFVQLDNGVEGLIHISELSDDYYVLHERQMALIGERTRRVFRIGDPVRVVVIRAVKEDLRIDFGLVEHLREATYVGGEGPGAIVYDEDLTPKERRETERRRREAASRASGRRERDDKRHRARRDRKGEARAGVRLSDWNDGEEERSAALGDMLPHELPYDAWDEEYPDPRAQRGRKRGGRGREDEARPSADGRIAGGRFEAASTRRGGYRTWPTWEADGGSGRGARTSGNGRSRPGEKPAGKRKSEAGKSGKRGSRKKRKR
ncbi:ribonuclease R [Alicyclobacillus acidocaldarius subsp. acidocaldarius DSM 446]|uniref:Ribonuclease R n=1 Tax=Alicyclobacillus acidocaldarius subsp. acidocaldarius (strain ATCC 27009 / DSM 446 / BCRC 14685 / JCM 5260 / KCTC 1825 / NBRC 15652 / NCIMB 11725 / NRRL B-14509 / 104-IA) TaxID=521098 RepID=C8WU28_ALIAD|nr:ribonuclease R [Alicyclobacillus acidocaldarius subsp. acidocaldarius DSM 446]